MDVIGAAAEVGIYILVALAVVVLLFALGLVVWVPVVRAVGALGRRIRATRDPR